MRGHLRPGNAAGMHVAVVAALVLVVSLAAAPASSVERPAHALSYQPARGSAVTAQIAKAGEVRDPDRYSQNLTAWWWMTNASPDVINDKVREGYRLSDLEVRSSSPKFAATFVHNSGVYGRTWWWYFGLTSGQVGDKLDENGARLIDLERYTVGGKTRYAVIMVLNSGPAAKTWWYYFNVSTSFVANKVDDKKARIVDLETRKTNGKFRHDVILIKNKGVDASAWWWYVNVTPDFIADKLNKNKARLIDIERNGNRFDVVMERNKGQYWWWYYGKTAAQVQEAANQNGARIYRIEPYVTGGKTRYAAIMINDLDAVTTKLRNIMAKGVGAGRYGVYLKPVGQSAVVALQSSAVFEPASAIKVVHHLTELRQVMLGLDALSDNDFEWYHYPGQDTSGACPKASDETPANLQVSTVQFGLTTMMKNSDNRTTRGFQLRFGGNPSLNATAALAGMDDTELRQVLGCGFRNGLRNDLTLVDAGKLYEGVIDGSVLNDTNGARAAFWSSMIGGPINPNGAIAAIVKDEAAKLGVTAMNTQRFLAAFSTWSKGGSYDVCPTSGACSPPYEYIRSLAGRAVIPFRVAGGVSPVNYVFGRFVEKLTLPCRFQKKNESNGAYGNVCPKWANANAAIQKVDAELFRAEIRNALETWLP
jgi:hypothetical protein